MEHDLQRLMADFHGQPGRLICIVMPVFNESGILPKVMDELFLCLGESLPGYRFEILFIDDASRDGSFDVVLGHRAKAPKNVCVSVCRLSRNSGGHIAITAGLNLSRGDFTIVMASDGQDPPELIGKLIEGWKEGGNIVFAARSANLDQSPAERGISRLAWRIMGWCTGLSVPEKGCDVLGIDRRALDAFNRMDERNTTFIFRIFSLGFRQKQIEYVKRARMGGRSSWTIWKKIHLMFDAITGYSSRPLRMVSALGLIIFVILGFRWLFMVLKIYLFGQEATDRAVILNSIFTSLAVVILLLGVIGDYIWRILDETRKRPIYEIAEVGGDIFGDTKANAHGSRSEAGRGENGK